MGRAHAFVPLLLAGIPVQGPPPLPVTDAHLTVDFAHVHRLRGSLVGFTHSISPAGPPDRLIAPLHPGLWRGTSQTTSAPFSRVGRLGARYTYAVSDDWGYPPRAWRRRGPPYARPASWRRLAGGLARTYGGRVAVWDIWNEPDGPSFWDRPMTDLFETWRQGERAIRAVLPRALVAGPSLAAFNANTIHDLLEFCLRRGCQVNVISWHELLLPAVDIPNIAARLRFARRSFVDNPRYRRLRIRELHINEVGNIDHQFRPGETLAYFDALERGGADAAARACWEEPAGGTNCSNDTLDGVLTPALRPRAVWWALRRYADGRADRIAVSTRSDDPGVVALAARRTAGARGAQVVIGAYDPTGPSSSRVVHVTLRGLRAAPATRGARRVRVALERIPATGTAPLRAPLRLPAATAVVRRGAAAVTVGPIGPSEALVLRIRRA